MTSVRVGEPAALLLRSLPNLRVACDTAQMSTSDLPKIGAPASRALASIGVTRLAEITEFSDAELLALHGFGPRALSILRDALADGGLPPRP